jgi:esterase/lipase superfamily enzyme
MDNSLHELGHAYDSERLLYWINELKPDEFIVPDVWQDRQGSIKNAREWSKIKLSEGVTKVAVVQAMNLMEAMACYQDYRDLGYQKIAFSYGADYYKTLSNHPNPHLAKALGRVELISRLYDCDIILNSHKVHLLGTACPFEFSLYKNMSFIESIDTSNPIMATIDGTRYNTLGMHSKPKSNMNDNVYMDLKDIDKELLYHNIESFKNLIK